MLTEKFLSKKIGRPVVLEKPHGDLVYIIHYGLTDITQMSKLDKELNDHFIKYGYEVTGSGYNFFANERDIRYQRREK